MSSEPIRSSVRIFREDVYNKSFDLEFFREDLGEPYDILQVWTPTAFIMAVGESLKVLCGEAIEIISEDPPENPVVLGVAISFKVEGLMLQAHTVYASSRLALAHKEDEVERLYDLLVPQITECLKPLIGGA